MSPSSVCSILPVLAVRLTRRAAPVAQGSMITQVYSVLTSWLRYYDTIEAKEGATLVVNGILVGPLADPGALGTSFEFVPTVRTFTFESGRED